MRLKHHLVSSCLVVIGLSMPWHSALAQSAKQADYIVAVVNSEPITNGELSEATARLVEQLKAQRQYIPSPQELRQGVLERLINDRAQLSMAREYGVHIEDSAIDQAEESIAQQNSTTVSAMHQQLIKQGLAVQAFRDQLRDQLTLSRFRERQVDSQVRVSDQEVDKYLAEQQAKNSDPLVQEVNLGHLLISVSENATPEQKAAQLAKAKSTLARARAGEDFASLVAQLSDADKSDAGAMGLRPGERYPSAFLAATQNLPVGAVSEVVQTAAGFHILKVLERKTPSAIPKTMVQTHARHILLTIGPKLSQAEALAKLAELRQTIVSGKADFAAMAREYSQDGSAKQGGDLGWANPGMYVPEFEAVMSRLVDGQVSAPMVSRYGVHLIQVIERRTADVDPREVRESVRAALRSNKMDEAYAAWVKDVRDRAFVEIREPGL